MDATATLTATPAGLHLRLSSRGYTFATHTAPATDEPAITTANRILTGQQWTTASDWHPVDTGPYPQWTALINHTGPNHQTGEQP